MDKELATMRKVVRYANGKDSEMITLYDKENLMQENGIIKGVFVYSLTVNFKTNEACVVFLNLSRSQLNKLKNKFASNCNKFIKTIAKALDFDPEDMPRIFNDKTIVFTPERAVVKNGRTDEVEREYIFDL